MVVSSERHSLAMNLFEHVAKVKPRGSKPFREQIDKYLMHPYLGYVFLGGILFSFFWIVFSLGKHIEEPILALFEQFAAYLGVHLSKESLLFTVVNGLIQGLSGRHWNRLALPDPLSLGTFPTGRHRIPSKGRIPHGFHHAQHRAPREIHHSLRAELWLQCSCHHGRENHGKSQGPIYHRSARHAHPLRCTDNRYLRPGGFLSWTS